MSKDVSPTGHSADDSRIVSGLKGSMMKSDIASSQFEVFHHTLSLSLE